MALGTPCALMIFPTLFEVTAITQQMLRFLVIAEICCLMAVLALEGIDVYKRQQYADGDAYDIK